MAETLIEWTEHYFRHKDIFDKKLENIIKEKEHLILKYKDRKDIVFINAVLEKEVFKALENYKEYDKLFIICAESRTNIDFIIENWKEILIKNLTIVFVNIKMNNRVLLNPFVHNMICDETTLESGIRALFN